MTGILDGNADIIGVIIDKWLLFLANLFGGLGTFGSTMGVILGATFVFVLLFVLLGKIQLKKIVGVTKP